MKTWKSVTTWCLFGIVDYFSDAAADDIVGLLREC